MRITSSKLLWGGLTLIVAVAPLLSPVMADTAVIELIGRVLMIIGAIMHLVDR